MDAGSIADNIARVINGLDAISFMGVGFAILVYMLPTILAAVLHNHPGRVVLIGVLNFLFGWTGLGWFALIAWAIFGRPKSADEDVDLAPYVHSSGTG